MAMALNAAIDLLQARMAPLFANLFSADLERAHAHVDRLCLHLCFHITAAFQLLRCEPELLAQLVARIGAVPESIYLLRTVLDILREEGFASEDPAGFQALAPHPGDESDRLQREAAADCPEAAPTFDLIARCHAGAVDFVTGRKSGLAVMLPRGDLALWERVHSTDRIMSIYADLATVVLEAIAAPRCRVLEVGGGVGAVLQRCAGFVTHLPFDEYCFTDLGQLFVQNAQRTYGGTGPFSFATVDVDRPMRDQGLSPSSFDTVIGVNVLHSAKRLRHTLREIWHLLKPGGYLILGEGSPPDRHRHWRLDVVYGFLQGWWDVSAEPPWRPRSGFLLPQGWREGLLECGFVSVYLLPGEDFFREAVRGGVIVAARGAD